ncbi:MAG: FlgD immunoglobulin-like domain containing protein [candidate division WOR-3 bacterium]
MMLKKLSVTGMAVILPLITTAGAITLERVIPVADTVCGGATGGGARYLAIDGSKLYYVATEGMTLVLDLGSFTVRGEIPTLGEHPAIPGTDKQQQLFVSRYHKLYVAGRDSGLPIMTIVSTLTDSITARYPVTDLMCMAYNDSEGCVVITAESCRLRVIDCRTDSVRAVITTVDSCLPDYVFWNHHNNCYYVITGHYQLYPVLDTFAWCTVFDSRTNTVVDTFCLQRRFYRGVLVHPHRNKLYFGLNDEVAVVDGDQNRIVRWIPFLGGQFATDSVGNKLYLINAGSIGVVDCNHDTLIKEIFLGGGGYLEFCCIPELDRLAVICDNLLAGIDCAGDSLVFADSTFRVNPWYAALTWDPVRGQILIGKYYFSEGTALLLAYDPVSWQVRRKRMLGVERIWDLVHNRRQNRFYLLTESRDSFQLWVVDGESGNYLQAFTLCPARCEYEVKLYPHPDERRLYIPDPEGGRIRVFDCDHGAIVYDIPVRLMPTLLTFFKNRIYCSHTDYPNGYLSIIDSDADTVIKVLDLPLVGTSFVIFYPEVNKYYVQGYWDNRIAVMDLATDELQKLIRGIPAGQGILSPAIRMPAVRGLYVVFANILPNSPFLVKIDVTTDSIVKVYSDLNYYYATFGLVNHFFTNKLYLCDMIRPYYPFAHLIGVYDVFQDTVVNEVSTPIPDTAWKWWGINADYYNYASHPNLPFFYAHYIWGVAKVDCVTDSVVSFLRLRGLGEDWRVMKLDPVDNRIYLVGDSRIFVLRDEGPGVTFPPPEARSRIRFDSPTVIRDRLLVSLQAPAASEAQLSIFDAGGRLLRQLQTTTGREGRVRLQWDGSDVKGHQTAAGVYFVVLESGSDRYMKKVVRIR